MSVDPLYKMFVSTSPFAHALNCPTFFVDADGRVIIGNDGKPVKFSFKYTEGGDKCELIIESNNVDKNSDAYRIFNALNLTAEGRNMLSLMEESEVKYKVKKLWILCLDDKESLEIQEHGETKGVRRFKHTHKYRRPKVHAYLRNKERDRMSVFNEMPEEYLINTIVMHEIWCHNENIFYCKLDRMKYSKEQYRYNLDLFKRAGKAEREYGKDSEEYKAISKETLEFETIVINGEYFKIKFDLENSIKLMTTAIKNNVISKEEGEKKIETLNKRLEELESMKTRVEKRIEDFNSKKS